MATPMKQEMDKSENDELPEHLNPMSPKFDPMRALYDRQAHVPMPEAKQFNNVAEFENFLTGKDAKTFQEKRSKKSELPGIIAFRAAAQAKENVRKAAIMAKSAGPSKSTKTQQRRMRSSNVLTKMEGYKVGPLSLLKKCAEERLRVVVVVRAAVAVRSRCRGYVIAFDKHFNMALMDVDEKFIKPVSKKKRDNQLAKMDTSLEAPTTGSVSVQASESIVSSFVKTENIDCQQSSSNEGKNITDLRDKLKQSRLSVGKSQEGKSQDIEKASSRSPDFPYKSSHSVFSESERSKSKDSKSLRLQVIDSEKKGNSFSESHRKYRSSKETVELETSDKNKSGKVEVKRSTDFKEHYQNYLSDSNVYVKRRQMKLEEKSSKSDSESTSSSKERRTKRDTDLTRKFQPFWPLYKKWTESRCYSEYEIVTRHVNQLFIRGDNVVSVSIADC